MSTRSHRRNGSQSSNDVTGNGAIPGTGNPPIVTSATGHDIETTVETLIPIHHRTDMASVLTHFNTMSETFNTQFTTMSDNIQPAAVYSVLYSPVSLRDYQSKSVLTHCNSNASCDSYPNDYKH